MRNPPRLSTEPGGATNRKVASRTRVLRFGGRLVTIIAAVALTTAVVATPASAGYKSGFTSCSQTQTLKTTSISSGYLYHSHTKDGIQINRSWPNGEVTGTKTWVNPLGWRKGNWYISATILDTGSPGGGCAG